MKKSVITLLVLALSVSILTGITSVYADEGGLVITKSPKGETVDEGGDAAFTAIAENYSQIEWRVVQPDGEACWRNKEEIEIGFPGVIVDTYFQDGKEYLVLSNIPASLDYYYIQAKIWDYNGGYQLTDDYSCLLRVKVNGEMQDSDWEDKDPGISAATEGTATGSELQVPVITLNPADVELESGKTTVISVAAVCSGGELHYQWYKNTEDSTITGTAIPGATTPDYMPPENPGTVWYYCSVCCTSGTDTSAPAVSATAAITYPSAQPEEPVGESAVSDDNDVIVDTQTREPEKDNTFMVALGAVIVAALGCGTAIFVSMNKKQQKRGTEFSAPRSENEEK